MHNKWDISKIEAVIQELNKRLNYQCNLKIEISKRAQKRMGAFFYRKNNGRIEPLKFVFAQCLLDGSYSEEVVKEVIIHEYLHYYCDTITGVSNGHNSYFKKMCRIMGISDSATFKYDIKRKSCIIKLCKFHVSFPFSFNRCFSYENNYYYINNN